MITDLFKSPSELRAFAPQMPTDGRIDNFEAYYRPQVQKMVDLLGQDTFDLLKNYYGTEEFDATTVKGQAVVFMRAAMANLMAIPYFIFEASQRNNTTNNLYRYQEDQQIETYLENGWTELNFLINHIESRIVDFTAYADTHQYKLRQTLFIKNAVEFKRYYGAFHSTYFFNNIVFIIEEVQNDEIRPRIKAFPEVTDENMIFLIGKAIAYETLSRACKQLDYTELPRGLRNDIAKEINAKNGKETEIKTALSAFFHNKAGQYFLKIEEANNASRNAGTYILPESTLTADDKFYMP